MTPQEKALLEIELKNTSWESQWMKEKAIWDEISMRINSYTDKEKEFWIEVMDLYNAKYR